MLDEVSRLHLTHEEGEPAILTLWVLDDMVKCYRSSFEPSMLTMNDGPQTLFQGFLHHPPIIESNGTYKMVFTAKALDEDRKREALLCYLHTKHKVVDFFKDPTTTQMIEKLLEETPYILYWNREDLSLSLSHYLGGGRQIDLSNHVITHKLIIPIVQTQGLVINIHGQWNEHGKGYGDLMPKITSHFSDGIISTLTPAMLEKTWPKKGPILDYLKEPTGYTITESSTEVLQPSRYSPGLWVHGSEEESKKRQCFEQFFYRAKLRLSYSYHQKHVEFCTIVLGSQLQNIDQPIENTDYDEASPKFIHNTFVNLNSPSYSYLYLNVFSLHHWAQEMKNYGRLFETRKGQDILRCAYNLGIDQLNKLKRVNGLQVSVPWEIGKNLTLDDEILVNLDQIWFCGKVAMLEWSVVYDQATVRVEAFSMMGEVESYVASDHEFEVVKVGETEADKPLPQYFAEVVDYVDVINTAQEQFDQLLLFNNNHQDSKKLQDFLQTIPIKITLGLRSLKTTTHHTSYWRAKTFPTMPQNLLPLSLVTESSLPIAIPTKAGIH